MPDVHTTLFLSLFDMPHDILFTRPRPQTFLRNAALLSARGRGTGEQN